MRSTIRLLLIAISLPIVAIGCSKSQEPVAVRGQVSFRGGPPPAVGTIYFTPANMDGTALARPGFGKFGQDGKFSVTTRNPEDGLFPGTYTVRVDCWSVPATPLTPPAGKSYVPADYRAPELTVDAQANDPIQVNYNVP